MNRPGSTSGAHLVLAAVILLAAMAPAVRGDMIRYQGVAHEDVRITDLREGMILFETTGGLQQQVPVEQVQSVRVEAYPVLAEGDRALDGGDYPEAIEAYADLFERADQRWLRVLVGAKLVVTLDRAGRFEEAVDRYIELLRVDQGSFVRLVRPRRVPDDAAKDELLGRIDQALRNTTEFAVRRELETLRGLIESDGEEPAGEEAAVELSNLELLVGEAEANRDPILERIRSGEVERALEQIEAELERNGAHLSKLLYQRGLCERELGRPMAALVSFSRVFIHYRPSSPYYVPALIEAGKVYRQRGGDGQARRLWEEAARYASEGSEEAEEVRSLLSELGEAGQDGGGAEGGRRPVEEPGG